MIRVRRLQTPVGDRLTNVLLADLPPQETLDDLVELLYQEHRDVLGSTEVLLIRGSADSNERPPESNLHVADLLKRVPNLPIHVLFSHAHRIDLSENLNDRLPSLDEFGSPAGVRNFLKALQQEELRQLALETQAILPAREGSGTAYHRVVSLRCSSALETSK